MTESERRRRFSRAFIQQARSDWRVHGLLAAVSRGGRGERGASIVETPLPICHRLHYLQMTCEKLAKAYRLEGTKSPVDTLVKSHVGFAKFVGPFMLATLKDEYEQRHAQLTLVIDNTRTIAREIEKMAPAVDRAHAPENAEYPWEQGSDIIAPCEYGYPALDLLEQPGGRAFLKLVARALESFGQN